MAKKSQVTEKSQNEDRAYATEAEPMLDGMTVDQIRASGQKCRVVDGKIVILKEKSEAERMEAFIANVNHEMERVMDWTGKLLTHTTSTTYPLSNEAIDAILNRFNENAALFNASVEKFRNKDKKVERPGLLSVSAVKKE